MTAVAVAAMGTNAAEPAWARFAAGNVLPFEGPAVSSSTFAAFEVDAADAACDDAWRALGTREAYDGYRLAMRREMYRAIGTFPERTPLNAKTVATCRRDGYTIEKVIFESMPNVFVTGNLFIPDGSGRRPAVVMSCGHSAEGKDCDIYLRACVIAAKRGFVTFMFDPYQQGERRMGRLASSVNFHTQMGLRGELIDWSAPLLRIWDGLGAMCYLLGAPLVGRRASDLLVLADVLAKRYGGKRPHLVVSGFLSIPAAHAVAADPAAFAQVALSGEHPSWREALVAGAEGDGVMLRYADVVPRACLSYDWPELLGRCGDL